jgi:intein/homing endonuclease
MEPCNDMLCNGDTPPDPPEPDCFVAGTKVTMADGTEKNIEEIEVGDVVKSWNEETGEIRDSKVVKLIQPMHDDMLVIRFSNGAVNENTFDHPYYVKDKGWCSHSPTLTKERYDIDSELFEVGDICYHNNDEELEEVEVISIKENWGEVQTYIFELDTDNTFFANGVLVHNKTGGNGSGGQGEEPEVIEEPGCEGPRCDE